MSALLCRACGGDVLFGFNRATKRRIPMEPDRKAADSVPRPNLAVSRDHLGSLFARPLKAGGDPLLPNEWLGLAHAAVCPARQARPRPATAADSTT